jgi:hypothetical protein
VRVRVIVRVVVTVLATTASITAIAVRADGRPSVGARLDVAADGEDQALRRSGDLGDRGLEGLGIARRRLAETADLAHVLAGCRLDFAGRCGIVLVTKGSDASAHAGSVPRPLQMVVRDRRTTG